MAGRKNPNKLPTRMVRLKEATVARLDAYRESLVKAIEAGQMEDIGIRADCINPSTKEFTFDDLVNLLLDHKESHRKRSKEARQRKKQSRQADQGQAGNEV